MNRIYRLVWSRTQQAWIPVSEISGGLARGGNKSTRSKLLVASLSLCSAIAQANPSGGVVTAGSGSIAQTANTTTIQQSSQNLSLNWNSFNIAANQIVNFVQPSAAAIAVNRIFDTSATQILGQLNANGQVYLINPNGIVFGQGSQVNVGGLVASTLDVNDASLNSASKTFSGTGTGSIINKGNLVAANGGYIALIANQVSNQGIISAQLGSVALAGGSDITLTFADNSLVQVQVNQSTLNNLAENKQLVVADGGQVFMSAGAKNSLLASVVNNTGIIEAQTVSSHAGVITLLGGMEAGTVNVAGTLDASAPNGGNGGAIETSAATVKVADNTIVTTKAASGNTGTWLIDPTNFTIASGSGALTGSSIGATTLQNALTNTDMSITTSANGSDLGDINVNAAFAWGSHLLTLNALNNININATMTATGTASLALNYGLGAPASGNTSQIITGAGASVILPASTTNFTTIQGSTDGLASGGVQKTYTVIDTLGTDADATIAPSTPSLQGMAASANLSTNYALGSNIEACLTGGTCSSGTTPWNSGAGFTPIGNGILNYIGTFNGLGHVISNLTINSNLSDYIGLFGYIENTAQLSNIGLSGLSVTNSGSRGYCIGGLVGYNFGGTINNSYSTGSVGSVTGHYTAGGLVGLSNLGTINNSYSTASVAGDHAAGGLVARLLSGTINNSYSTGSVIGHDYAGGLVGWFFNSTINNSYSTGSVTGTHYLGGLVGMSYLGTVTGSFWDTQISGQATSAGGTGMTTANMTALANFTSRTTANGNANPAWNFNTSAYTWNINSSTNGGYSFLCSIVGGCVAQYGTTTTIYLDLIPGGSNVYGTAPTYTFYNGSGTPGAGTYVYSTAADYTAGTLVTDASATGSITWSGAPTSSSSVGTYHLTYGGGISLGNSAYTLAAGNAGSWSVAKANATVTGNSGALTYTGLNQSLSGFSATGLVNGETASVLTGVSASGSGTNAGAYNVVASGTDSNYNLTFNPGLLTINPAMLTVTANNQTRMYGAANPTFTQTITGFVNGENSSVVSGTARAIPLATTTTGIGQSLIIASDSGLLANNYIFGSAVNGVLTITPATLTVTADNQTRMYSAVNPTFTQTITGFVNDENSSVVTGIGSGSSTATRTTDVGTALITASNSGLSAANYNFDNLVNGALTIYAMPALITSVSQLLIASITTPTVFTTPTTTTPSTPAALTVANVSSSDPSPSGSVSSGLNIIDGGINANGHNPGLYVQVLDGMIHISDDSGAQNFSAGQFGYTSNFQPPPVILPTNSGIQFTPPPAFLPTDPGTPPKLTGTVIP